VIDAGWGDWSGGWSRVQPDAAKTTRVCTYDRAGMGHSEAGPLPRTAEHFARELHALLQRAGVQGPYVLVGHSLGGAPVRVFAHTYAPEVAGVVLIEAMNPGEGGTPAPAPPPGPGALSITDTVLTTFLTLPARVGLVRVVTGPVAGLSPDEANAYAAHSVTVRSLQAAIDEGRGMAESLAQARRVTTLGSVPLLVLSRGLPEDGEQKWQREQTELLQLSSDSHQVFADQSRHNIQLDQPAAAIGAIVTMVEQVRRQTRP
jgi:pimeloyl-ACP methyl ester carboxylesterase